MLCDKLICGVLTEGAVLEKKPKPVLGLSERMAVVAGIKYVDAVVAQDEYSPTKNCNSIKPDVLFESSSHEHWGNNEGRRIIGMPYYPVQSSTEIKKKVIDGSSA